MVEAELAALAESIAEKGVVQPILVRPIEGGARYEIVAGERRWRAAQRARLHEIPALVRELTDRETPFFHRSAQTHQHCSTGVVHP